MTRRVAVVTGAGGGIGRAIVSGLVRRAFTVVASDVSDEALGGFEGERIVCQPMDVTRTDSVRSAAAAIEKELGRVDVLVNNAGHFAQTPVIEFNEERIQRIIEVNLTGTMRTTAVFGRIMSKRQRGRIINVASTAGVRGAPLAAAYAAAKAGVIAHTMTAAREFASAGIAVNAVAPGYCETPMLAPHKVFVEKLVVPKIPMGRLATADEVAEVVVFLATCRTPYMTGTVLPVDGGLLLG